MFERARTYSNVFGHRTFVRPYNLAPISTKLWENAFQTMFWRRTIFFRMIFGNFGCSFSWFSAFWRSKGFFDVKISFCNKFCFRYTLPEICTTKHRRIRTYSVIEIQLLRPSFKKEIQTYLNKNEIETQTSVTENKASTSLDGEQSVDGE